MPTVQDLDAAVSAAEAAVTSETTVDGSAATLLSQITALYQAALASGGPPQGILDRVTALTAALVKNSTDLSAAVALNTPAAPASAKRR